MDTTSDVWELNVFVPAVAKSCHADHGPLRLGAVQYTLCHSALSSVRTWVGKVTDYGSSYTIRFHARQTYSKYFQIYIAWELRSLLRIGR
jgi:hypothetical protein